MSEKWHPIQFDIGPLTIFRNAGAGVGLEVNGWRLWGPGSCGERRWFKGTTEPWCKRPFGHDGEHVYSKGITLGPGESATFVIRLDR